MEAGFEEAEMKSRDRYKMTVHPVIPPVKQLDSRLAKNCDGNRIELHSLPWVSILWREMVAGNSSQILK